MENFGLRFRHEEFQFAFSGLWEISGMRNFSLLFENVSLFLDMGNFSLLFRY